MKNTQNEYLLSEEEKRQYRGLLSQAFNAASLFNGSEETYEQLFDSLILMEEFVRERNDNKSNEALEISFAEQACSLNQQFYTVSGLLDHASNQVYGMLARLGDLKEVLNALSVGGAHIDYSSMVYVLTDEALITGDGDAERTVQEFIKQPRLAILVEELRTIGVYTDDLVIRVGKIFEDKIRKLPYIVVEIPRLGKQVAVCDQYGEITFVSQNTLEPYVWASYTKKQLKELDGVKAVSYTESWPFRICNLLAYGTEDMTPKQGVSFPKVDIKEYVKNRKKSKMELNEDMIINHVLVYLKENGCWPTAATFEPIKGFPDERWQTWNSALTAGRRGLPGNSTLWQVIQNFVAREAKLYEEAHGFLPMQHAGPLIGRPDIAWELVDKASTDHNRGGLYSIYMSAGLIKKRRHKKQTPQRLNKLTPDVLMQHTLAFLKENWRWPDEYITEPISGLSEENWLSWDYFLWTGGRGLSGGTHLYKMIWDWVTERALEFEKQHGHRPHPGSGQIQGTPGVSWDLIDFGLRRQKGWKMPLEIVLKQQLEHGMFSRWRAFPDNKNSSDFPSPKNS